MSVSSGQASVRIACLLGLCILAVASVSCTSVGDEGLYDPLDGVPPEVVQTYPAQGWLEVPLRTTIRVWFSEAIEPTTVDRNSLYLLSGESSPAGSYRVILEPDGRGLVEFEPYESLIPGVTYHLHVNFRVADLMGNGLATDVLVDFETIR